MDLLTIVGNRPQFIKMGPVSAELRARGHKEFVVHTGQHYDDNMSDVFFRELALPRPKLRLQIDGRTHGAMTGEMLIKLEPVLMKRKPDGVLIYGDTNSTLAAALAAAKLNIPIAHVEAGPRLYDLSTPEEINRLVADNVASLRFCPDRRSVQNLKKENITKGVHFTGDVMFDAFLRHSQIAARRSKTLMRLGIAGVPYALLTVHRPNNTDDVPALERIVTVLERSPMRVLFVVHPRTEAALERSGLRVRANRAPNATLIPAVGYLDMLALLNGAEIVLTDSGGLQKEAFFAGKPVMVLLHRTPWPQLAKEGWQRCAWKGSGIDATAILKAIRRFRPKKKRTQFFGDGNASKKIVALLEANW